MSYSPEQIEAMADNLVGFMNTPAAPMLRAYAATIRQQAARVDEEVPAEFAEYVAKNYSGEVVFSDPQWHAKRLWRAARRSLEAARPAERQVEAVKRWPFVESPGKFTERLREAMQHFPLIGAVRHVLIENPPVIDTHPAAPVGVPTPLPMDTAPRDGTMLRLLVRLTVLAAEDAEEAWTIGSNSFDTNGEDVWQFAGWCWEHDHFTQGKGTPIGWLPMLAAAPCAPQGEV